jgi:hypothetical protein
MASSRARRVLPAATVVAATVVVKRYPIHDDGRVCSLETGFLLDGPARETAR